MLNQLTVASSKCILCYYANATNRIEVTRISNIPGWYFERVVFPGQRLLFEAPQEAQLEIHRSNMATTVLSDKILCERLQVDSSDNTTQSPVVAIAHA